MKRIILYTMMMFLSLTLLPLQSKAATTSLVDHSVESKRAEPKELPRRSYETNVLKKLNTTPSEKKNTRDIIVVSERHDHHRGTHGVVYFSVGGVVFIVLLAIILL